MLAVVQIGSKARRSACSTARNVRAFTGVGCALSRPGADSTAAVAALPLTNARRDGIIWLRPSGRVSLQPKFILAPSGTSGHLRLIALEAFVMAGLVRAIHDFVV